ncbi:hypothetical protein C1646_750792 [Rhizophagus diaphanus]|nr:hypothetical protein C1646_750792 [Rhizophagus diaphanus] [Rhizophagus sp. MUCL 43196]
MRKGMFLNDKVEFDILNSQFKKLNVATKLAENIFQSVNEEMNKQINKEMSRRKELRFMLYYLKPDQDVIMDTIWISKNPLNNKHLIS